MEGVGCWKMYWPTVHVLAAMHDGLVLVLSWYVFAGHTLHTRSDDGVGAEEAYVPAAHRDTALHVVCAVRFWNSFTPSHCRRGLDPPGQAYDTSHGDWATRAVGVPPEP